MGKRRKDGSGMRRYLIEDVPISCPTPVTIHLCVGSTYPASH